ncbi:MAG: hypothetical protein IKW10_06890 [Oscillospiraceae bacterium]|nr:hypothetical protein [Oscillospiraceae bacterium]
MKKSLLTLLLVVALVASVFAIQAFATEETAKTPFAPYTDADGLRQYCACGNKFVADENGTIAYVNGEDGCKNHKDENGVIVDGCDGTLITWSPVNATFIKGSEQLPYTVAEDGTVSGMAYYLTQNTKSNTQQFGTDAGKYYLDLNGFAFTRNDARVITPQENVHLYITDTSAEKDGYIACVDTNDTDMTGQGCTIWFRYGNSSVTLFAGTIDGSQENPTSSVGGAAIYAGDSLTGNKVSQFGGTIISGNGPAGRGGFMMGNGVYNLYDGNVIGGEGKNGGALYVGTNATFNMYSGSVTGGKSSGNGGCIHSNGTIYIYGGSISGGTANSGYGDLLNLQNGTCTITGGTIGKSTHDGIYISKDSPAVLTIGGKAQIEDLKINGSNTFITAEDFTGSVGLTIVNKGYVVTTVKDTQQAACFSTNQEGFSTKTTGSLGILVNDDPVHANHCVCGGHAQGKGEHTCADATWQAWGYLDAEKTSFPKTSGNYYLVSDISFSSLQNIPDTEQVHICLNGHTIKMSKIARINVRNEVSVTDCGNGGQILSSVALTSSATYRTMFYVYNGATLNLYNGIFDARESKVSDGAIAHIGNDAKAYTNIYNGTYYGATLTMENSTLTQSRGGAFNITATSELNMYGGQIIGGEATAATAGTPIGGCVAIYSGYLNMYGGSITEGKANSVYLRNYGGSHLNLYGNAVIDDLYVDGEKKFTISDDFAGSVGLTVATKNHEVVILKNAQQAACFYSNEEGFSTKATGSLGVLVNDDPVHATHCICGGHGADKGEHTCADATWQAWGYLEAEKTSLPKDSGNYYLVADVTLAAQVEVPATADVSICLNGHDITGTGTNRVWAVRNHLAVTDCSENPGTVSATYSGNYGGIFFVYQNAIVDIYGGNWDASQGNATQGGIAIIGNSAAATMNIYGGTFHGTNLNKEMEDREARGGVFYMIASSNLNIYGGEIHGGNAVCGGVIYVNAGTVRMYGGQLIGGTATKGGSVYINTGGFGLYDGEVTGGQAQYGGNFYIPAGKVLATHGGRITNGIAHHDTDVSQGGNIYSEADITLENCVIFGGKATSGTVDAEGKFVAGGVSSGGNIMSLGDLTMIGCTISDGEATHGGNMRLEKSTVTLTNCTISGGKATLKCDGTTNGNGGNVYSTGTATTTINGCTIIGGEAQRGGSIGAWGPVTIIDTSVTGGHANVNGGNIMTYNNGYITLQGNTVISGGTSIGNGGNIATTSSASKTNTIEDGVQVIGGAADGLGDCIFSDGGVLKLKGAPVITGIFANNGGSAYGMDVSELNVTTPIHLGVNKLGVIATSASDNSDMFTMVKANMALYFDSENGQLIAGYREMENVYVDATNGNDDNSGAQDAPVKTFAQAMNLVKNNGTIHLVGTVEVGTWDAHGKTFVITGGELVMPITRVTLNDNVTFRDLTMTIQLCETSTSSNYGSYFFYCNGYTTVIEETVTVRYYFEGQYMDDPYHEVTYTKADGTPVTATATSTIYGGANVDGLTNTDLTILAGHWGNVYGGSNGKRIDGDVHLTVGGKINEGVDYVSHTHSSWHIICGGSRGGDISGTIYMNVTGGMHHTSTHGGNNGGTVGNIVMRVTGGRGMALYGGGRSNGTTVTGEINFYLEGGEWEQVFGGNLSSSLVGNVNIYVTGGKITRRLYGGCYSNCDESSGNWTADNFVTGDVNLYIGSGATISCDLKDPDAGWESLLTGGKYADRGIYGHSRRGNPNASDAENARIIFLDQAAYTKHKGKLKAQDTIMQSIMRGVTAADYICYLGTNASGNVITVGATEVEDNVNNALDLPAATATITVAEASYPYEGAALTPATVTYSENWTYGDLAITYANNDKAGTATASITYEGATASVSFVIEEICKHETTTTTYAQIEGTETHTITVTCECGEVMSQTTEACADTDKNYLCDVCGGAVPCKHENTTTTYAQIEGTETHTITVTCECGEQMSQTTEACVDSDKDLVCDLCAGRLTPSVVLTHISLDPSKDALGYKAAASNLPEGAHVEISLWVNENKVVTKVANTLRLVNILANNGGEITIYAKATIVDADGNVIAESAVAQTTMRETLETVNENFDGYTQSQQAAVKALVEKFITKLEGWNLDKIKN